MQFQSTSRMHNHANRGVKLLENTETKICEHCSHICGPSKHHNKVLLRHNHMTLNHHNNNYREERGIQEKNIFT